MASLQQLLAEEGFERGHGQFIRRPKPMKLKDRTSADHESIALPIYICHDLKSFDFPKQRSDKAVLQKGYSIKSSKREGSDSESSRIDGIGREEPAIDEVAVRAVISILSGYIGRYLKDEIFRESVREKFNSCLERRKKKESDNGIFANLELGVESIDKLVEEKGTNQEHRMKLLRNSIQLLSIVASLNSKKTRHSSTCGIPNSHLSAFSQLYLSIIYKLDKNDRISARHLLQVFCDSPYLSRTHLLPDLWEHFFLPHLLHLKVWYHKELELLSNLDYGEKDKRTKALRKVYNDRMDMGTTQFALYYKNWLKIGAKSPAVPSVPLPSRSYGSSRRRSSDSYTSHSSLNKNLFRTVFGPTERRSMDLDHLNRTSINAWNLQKEHEVSVQTDNYNNFNYAHSKRNQKAELWSQKSQRFRLFPCQSVPAEEFVVNGEHSRNNSIRNEDKNRNYTSELSRAITKICSSDDLSECEIAIRVIVKTWLNAHGDPAIEAELSKAPIIEGMLEVLFASNEDEILELAISILAELVAKNELNRQIVLNFDPQLEIFIKLLRSTSLFLKASVLLYLLKPKAKQMISTEWVPLILRVLEFGDQIQTLFTVCCSAQVAAFYLLGQLVNGFDEDKNFENARAVVSHGGLALLVGRIEKGEIHERQNTASIILCCIQADEKCRSYLAENLNKASLLQLIVLENHNCNRCAIALLTELLCLARRTQRMKFLDRLNNGWGGLSTMHIFLAYLQRASSEERPLAAAILLQLDLLGDPSNCSMYREEAIDALTAAMNCQTCSEKIQEKSARALLMLGGQFPSYAEEATSEKWLLKLAGFNEHSDDSFYSKYENLNEEEKATEIWQQKAALALFKSGSKGFLAALANCMVNGTQSLARASLFTVAWMSRFLHSAVDENFLTTACSILMPPLLESSSYDRALEERTLASLSLERLTKTSVSTWDRELIKPLQNHDDELFSVFTRNFKLQ